MDTSFFWNWFLDNNEQLTMLDDLNDAERQQLLDAMQHQLDGYCEGLTFEIGEPTPSGRTLVFSAEGDLDLFSAVAELVENAPVLDWWDVIAFRQPKGKGLKVQFDKYHFDTSKMFFQQLENESSPDVIGLMVALPDFPANAKEDVVDDLSVGAYVTLEAMIGEFDCATLVGYLDICPIPKDPFKEGFKPLDDFPDFVKWFKGN